MSFLVRKMQRSQEVRRLSLAFVITFFYCVVEVVGGFLTNSLALLSDAGHMVSDLGAIGLSLFAFRIARRPATLTKTYGYHRVEIVVALINGLLLWMLVGMIFHAAYNRFLNPPEVHSGGMLVVAAIGLGVNVIAGIIVYGSHHTSLNLYGAFLHIFSDALGSLGAICAAIAMLRAEWYLADPLISVFIGLLILYSSWSLVKESINILMQSVPKGLDIEEVRGAMEGVAGVSKVHDLHIWTVTSGIFTLTAHVVVNHKRSLPEILDEIEELLKKRFCIEHTTIQLETEDREEREFRAF